jgi:branched-chain amino acid transport system ATP-binding protein
MTEVRDIHTYYGDSHVLQGVSLSMSRGQVVGILGRNGMGKTTLIRSIIGFTAPRRGSVVFKDRNITAWPSNRAVSLGLGLVPQGRRVFPSLTVMENLEVAVRGGDGPGRSARAGLPAPARAGAIAQQTVGASSGCWPSPAR